MAVYLEYSNTLNFSWYYPIYSDANMLIEAVSFSSAGKIQPFLVSVGSNASLALDIHCHLKKEEVYGYLAGTWDLNTHSKF